MTKSTQSLQSKIATKDEKIQQLQNEKKLLMQKFKNEERKQRTRRLIERGAIVESLVQGALEMTNDEFMNYIKSRLGNSPQAPQSNSKTDEEDAIDVINLDENEYDDYEDEYS